MNMERNRRDVPWVGKMRFRTRILNVPSAPRFLARNTSAMPPAPSRRTISNWAISFGGSGSGLGRHGNRRCERAWKNHNDTPAGRTPGFRRRTGAASLTLAARLSRDRELPALILARRRSVARVPSHFPRMGDSTTTRPAPLASGTLAKTPFLHLLVYALREEAERDHRALRQRQAQPRASSVRERPAGKRRARAEPIAYLGPRAPGHRPPDRGAAHAVARRAREGQGGSAGAPRAAPRRAGAHRRGQAANRLTRAARAQAPPRGGDAEA